MFLWTGSLRVTVYLCTFLQSTPTSPLPRSLATLGHVYFAPVYVCPALGGADPLVCPASCPQDVPETLFPATRRSGPRRPGWRGWGFIVEGGSLSGHENEGGGGEGTNPTGSASFLPRLSLPGCQPGAGVNKMNPMASECVGGAWSRCFLLGTLTPRSETPLPTSCVQL